MDEEITQINWPEDKKVNDDTQVLTSKSWNRQMYQEKNAEYLPILKIVWMHQYEDTKTT